MGTLPGVYEAKKKDGSLYYRTSITYHAKHISIGSYNKEEAANAAYREARKLLDTNTLYSPDDYHPDDFPHLSYQKWICLINFKNNGFYIKTPIYLYQKFFSYHLSPSDILLFDADDLFYYSKHSIMRRGNHLFVAEYGMQTNIHSRYGIKNFAREGIDYQFVNGDRKDFRYSNIEIFNTYHGVTQIDKTPPLYVAKIHLNGDYLIGKYATSSEAAIAYNKAADCMRQKGFYKTFTKNYLESLSTEEYKTIYRQIVISKKIVDYDIRNE